MLGTFAVYYREPHAPHPNEVDLIGRAVHVAGIAIQRHELDEQLRALSTHIEAAREEERTGLARELHDQLGQSLTVLKMDLAWIGRRAGSITKDALLGKVNELSRMTDEIINQTRRISADLRPGLLDDLGLAAALSWQAQEFQKRTGIECTVRVKADGIDALPRDVSTTIFRALQEALTNVARHAGAKNVAIRLGQVDGWLNLVVRDDGKGIRPEHLSDPRSLGVVGMRERARRLGGNVAFDANTPDGGGTKVSFRLPSNPQTVAQEAAALAR